MTKEYGTKFLAVAECCISLGSPELDTGEAPAAVCSFCFALFMQERVTTLWEIWPIPSYFFRMFRDSVIALHKVLRKCDLINHWWLEMLWNLRTLTVHPSHLGAAQNSLVLLWNVPFKNQINSLSVDGIFIIKDDYLDHSASLSAWRYD